MYIYQNGKLYLRDGEQLVGVEIYSDKVVLVGGTETTLDKKHQLLTSFEVRCKFQLDDSPYIFPKEIEVDEDEPVIKAKASTRKPRLK